MKKTHLAYRLARAVMGLVLAATLAGPAEAAVGRTEASFGVTQNGAATYAIPIQATEGINGMTPRLSITYSGPGSRSILGVGFALSGLSYITPCRRTIAQDLSAAPVTLTANDRYCLDGARLRIFSGTYGATNATYRTEVDQLVRVTSLGSSGNIPGSFKVELPNGIEYEYGGSSNSKLMSGTGGGATPQFWAVSKITDTSDNSISFTYDNDAAQRRFRPSLITYTDRGSAGHYSIHFVYDPNPLPFKMQRYTPSLTGGARHEHDKVLQRIDLKHDNVTYRSYKLTYEDGAGDNKRLKEVQECAYNPAEDCLPATVFTWQSATDGHNALASTTKAVAAGVMPLDINGDGIEDLAWAASGTWRYMLGGASGFGSIVNTSVAATNPTKAMPIEWNGDGFGDLLIDWSDGTWRVLRGGASGFNTTAVAAGPGGIVSTTPNTSWTLADIDADGRDDLISVALNAALAINVRYNGASGFGAMTTVFQDPFVHTKASNPFIPNNGSTSSIRRPDFNGDGRTDLLIFGCIWETEPPGWCITDRWFQIVSEGTTFTNAGPIGGAAFNIHVRYGDFNGDGLTDAIYPSTSGNWELGFGQGSGGFAFVAGPSSAPHATYRTLTGDYDGDGLDDFYVARNSPNQWEVFRGTGTGLAATALAPSPAISAVGSGWMLIDQNGDSLPDLGRYDSGTLVWSLGTHKGSPAEHLLTATDGLANVVTFAYLPMTNNTVYVKGSGATFPEREFEGSAPLVRTMQTNPAGGTAYTFTYRYRNARFHGQGRSFLGMGQREVTDGRNGVFSVETYQQNYPYIGAPATVTIKQSSVANAKTIQTQTHTYLNHVMESTPGNERYLPYRSKIVTTVHEVGGVRDGDPITEVTETHTVNTSGNSTFVSIDVKDVDALSPETGQIYRTEVTSTYSQDSTNWCLALPVTRNETRILPLGAGSATRELDWQVDGAECRVEREIIEEGSSSLVSVVTDIGYDDCGNVDSISRYPAGLSAQARVTSIDYGTRCQRPMSITNPENHVSGIDYDWPLAVAATTTDPNGLVSTFERDAFGRLTRQLRPDGTGLRLALTACTSGNNWCSKGSSGARVKLTRTERTTTDTVIRTDEQFFDGIGRERWSHSASLQSGAAIVETVYDAFNRPVGRTQPFFTGGGSYPTEYTYDLIGRLYSIDAPVNEAQPSGRITSFSYQGRFLEVTDPKLQVTTSLNSVLGQLRSLTDPSPGGITTYAYHPFGELKSITDAAGNVTSWSINPRGFVIGTSDPDSGDWTYQVNAFGETEKIRDAKTNSPNWTTEFTFDKLSRLKTRDEAEGLTTLTWGTSAHNTSTNKYIGRLKSVSSPNGYLETYTFDAFSRLSKLRTTIDGENWDFDQAYWTTTGMPSVLTYPEIPGGLRLRVNHSFQENILKSISHYQGTTVFWDALEADAWGHYENVTLGNGVAAFAEFDQASGLPDSRTSWFGSTPLIDAEVDWDLNANVSKRKDMHQNLEEIFSNDSLNRFVSSTLNGSPNASIVLDAIGNITSKDAQTYDYINPQSGCTYYTHTQPRAVRKIGSTVYCYDKNGNMVKRGGSNISYTSFNLPSVINSGSNSSSLYYGAFRNRYKQVAVAGGTTETTTYVQGLFERVVRPSKPTEYRHYIPTGDGTTAIYTRRSDGSTDVYYAQRDHLGSPELITNSAGAEHLRLSFAAFGARRNPTTWSGAPPAGDLTKIADTARDGFTGHEQLDSVGLIHMNGRVYDPGAGRFLAADPILKIGQSQDVNSYSYAWNSPLSIIDPTGLVDREPTPVRPIDSPSPCFTCSGGSIGGDALDEFLNLPWETPVLGGSYDPPPFGPIASRNSEVKWDGKSFGAHKIRFGAQSQAKSTVGGPCPNCHSGGIVAPVVTPEVRAATTRFYQNLGEDFVPGAGLYQLVTGRYYFSGDEGSRLLGAINLLPYAGIAIQKVARGTTTLYRAVLPAELADIQDKGAFRSVPGLEGKYFTTSAEAASSYAKQAVQAFGDPPYTLIRTEVPNSIFRGLTPASVDRGIPAWVIPNDRLPGLVPQYLDSMPIPGL